MQYSDQILDEQVAPELSKLTKCGAPSLKRFPNYFSEFMSRSRFGAHRYKSHITALLTVFYRRIDFACVEYRLGRKRLASYCANLPSENSKTRFVRLSITHFETCVLHTTAAVACLVAINKSLGAVDRRQKDDEYDRLKQISNRVRHYDEDVFANGKIKSKFPISPVWLTDTAIKTSKTELRFKELHKVLVAAMLDAKVFAESLSDSSHGK